MLQPFPEAPAHTWNHMPHVRGAAEQPLLQTISGTTINDGLPCLYRLLDKSKTTKKSLYQIQNLLILHGAAAWQRVQYDACDQI